MAQKPAFMGTENLNNHRGTAEPAAVDASPQNDEVDAANAPLVTVSSELHAGETKSLTVLFEEFKAENMALVANRSCGWRSPCPYTSPPFSACPNRDGR